MKRIFLSFLIFLVGSFLIQTKAISYSSDPESFISEVIDEAKVILSSSSSSRKKRQKNYLKLRLKLLMLKAWLIILWKKRKEITPEELKKYEDLFEKYFLKSFTSRLTDYSDPKINVLSSEVVNNKYTIVKTMLLKTDKKPEVKIDWRVYTKDRDNPLIRDLIIEGLSLARTQKEEFASVLSANNNDINALFSTLENL